MIRLSLYHWLPIADNMLVEIEKRLRALPTTQITDIEIERDAITYHTEFNFTRDFGSTAHFPLHGKINQRGFCQHALDFGPVPGLPLDTLINDLVPDLKRAVGDLLFAISPDAVRNKLAILNAPVIPFQQFQSSTLEPQMDQAARAFLVKSQVTAILADERASEMMRAGLVMPALALKIKPVHTGAGAFPNSDGSAILFYSTERNPDEWSLHDSVIYKYCALLLYARFVDHTTSILQQARDNLIPLRGRLAAALQSTVAEHYETLTQIKRYLTYVNIKLPVVQKVIHHLEATRQTQTFAAKIASFDEPVKVFGYPMIRCIKDTVWQPPYLIGKIEEESRRLGALFAEDVKEIQIVSTELSQMLEGGLLSEQLQVSLRALDTVQSALEIERRSKNLANANKWAMLILTAAIGMLVANSFNLPPPWTLCIGIFVAGAGYFATMFALRRHASYFRLVIPIRANLPPDALAHWLSQHRLLTNKASGNQVICSWKQEIPVRLLGGPQVRPRTGQAQFLNQTFDVTIEFERRGLLKSITLETEYFSVDFDSRDLVAAIFDGLCDNECLKADDTRETSLYARALSLLELPLEDRLPALNKLLTLPSTQVSQIITTGESNQQDYSLSKQDLFTLQDLNGQPRAYRDWLSETLNNPTKRTLLALLGLQNVRSKLNLLERLEEEHLEHAQYIR